MKLEMFSVRDSKAEVFGRPFFTTTRGLAIRSFTDECNNTDPGNMLNKHRADFALFHLGSYEDSTGEFSSIIPQLVLQGNETEGFADTKVSKV